MLHFRQWTRWRKWCLHHERDLWTPALAHAHNWQWNYRTKKKTPISRWDGEEKTPSKWCSIPFLSISRPQAVLHFQSAPGIEKNMKRFPSFFSPERYSARGQKNLSHESRNVRARRGQKSSSRCCCTRKRFFEGSWQYISLRTKGSFSHFKKRPTTLPLSLSLPVRSARLLRKKREEGTQHFGYTNGALLNERTRKDTMMYDEA